MSRILISICLSDLPKDKIEVSERNGKKYMSFVLDKKREPDQYGKTHTVYVSQSKEEREAGSQKCYVGNGKEYVFQEQTNSTPTKPAPSYPDHIRGKNEPYDLPF